MPNWSAHLFPLQQPSQNLNIKIEPSLIAVGAKHIAIVLNSKAWFYEIKRNGTSFMYEHDYMTTIVKMKLNRDFVMAQLDNRVHLHKVNTILINRFWSLTILSLLLLITDRLVLSKCPLFRSSVPKAIIPIPPIITWQMTCFFPTPTRRIRVMWFWTPIYQKNSSFTPHGSKGTSQIGQ